jgi:predicted RNA binding protein YcfA (HicA-like mRNA interferase family)
MGRKLPLLKPREVRANLTALGFTHKRTDGSHETWERTADANHKRAVVTVDAGKTQFDKHLMKMMIRQSTFSRYEFCTGIIDKPATTSKPVTEEGGNA